MFGYLRSLISDPKTTIIFILLAFPGRILAICAHEYAHAWMADKCGDPTARNLGRLTLNPAKHLDVLGTIMMLVIGFGWAKPVPINPRNYRNFRKDDLKVSLAGIVMNLILFLSGLIVLNLMIVMALKRMPEVSAYTDTTANTFLTYMNGKKVLITGNYYLPISQLFTSAPYIGDYLIVPAFGRMAGYVYSMVAYFVEVNIVLAVFNIIPLPPLDGYHVVNDLLLHRSLFADPRVARNAMLILYLLIFSGVLGTGLGYVVNAVFSGIGTGFHALFGLIGLI